MTKNPSHIIQEIKSRLGSRLAILAHHYQRDEVVAHADIVGDSLELSRNIATLDAEHIVFCGVSFMAETAAILAKPGQKIHLPAAEAGCPMSEMAQAGLLAQVLEQLNAGGRKVVPLAYVNTQAAVKAVCGRFGGSVCTSANAQTMLKWALDQGDAVLFAPDRNLAHNTADKIAMPDSQRHTLSLQVEQAQANLAESGSFDMDAAESARLIIWPGYCSVHECFTLAHVQNARSQTPEAKIVVHPECKPEVVRAADAAGSTSLIIKYCAEAPEGATIVVGTEIHLVRRLAERYKGVKNIRPLFDSSCRDMTLTDENRLAANLQNLEQAEAVTVDEQTAAPARDALDRMLKACA
jgi:quinolinate synthase